MPHHHDVLDLEMVHGKLDHRQGVQIRVHHHIGDIAVHKHFARIKPGDFVGRNAAVGAADPEVFGRLLLRQLAEETGPLRFHARSPDAVVVEQVLKG